MKKYLLLILSFNLFKAMPIMREGSEKNDFEDTEPTVHCSVEFNENTASPDTIEKIILYLPIYKYQVLKNCGLKLFREHIWVRHGKSLNYSLDTRIAKNVMHCEKDKQIFFETQDCPGVRYQLDYKLINNKIYISMTSSDNSEVISFVSPIVGTTKVGKVKCSCCSLCDEKYGIGVENVNNVLNNKNFQQGVMYAAVVVGLASNHSKNK